MPDAALQADFTVYSYSFGPTWVHPQADIIAPQANALAPQASSSCIPSFDLFCIHDMLKKLIHISSGSGQYRTACRYVKDFIACQRPHLVISVAFCCASDVQNIPFWCVSELQPFEMQQPTAAEDFTCCVGAAALR